MCCCSTEPVWAAVFGALVLGEKLTQWGLLGAGIIIAGCLLTQIKLNAPVDGDGGEGGGPPGHGLGA